MPQKKILVGVNGGPISNILMEIAAKIAKLDKAKLFATYVFETPRALPLDAEIPEEIEKGDQILDKASSIAEEMGVDIETDFIQARGAGAGLVEQANDLNIDLIIVGMSSQPRIGEHCLGSTISYILKKSRCQVWIIKP